MMATWMVPANLPYALFVAGDERLGEGSRPALERVLEALRTGPPPAVELGRWIADHGRMGTVPLADLRAQLPAQTLAELGLESTQQDRLANATHGMLIAAQSAGALERYAPAGLLVLAAAMASAADGIVYDSGTFRVLPQWILESPLDGFLFGSIKNHVAIVTSIDAANVQTTTTLGLNKYGLFELQLRTARPPSGDSGVLVAALAQALVEARPAKPGPWDLPASFEVSRAHVGKAFATEIETNGESGEPVRLAVVQGPDATDIYWSVVVPDADDSVAAVEAAIRRLDGPQSPANAVDTALIAATRIARNRLSEAQIAFARRALTQDVVLVKTRFTTADKRTEYVWSRVEEWERTRVQAIVTTGKSASETVSIGDRVMLDAKDIVDWRVERANGEELGHFSAAALQQSEL